MATSNVTPRVWHGPALPLAKQAGGYWASKETLDLIWSSIIMILGTPLGTRVMLPEFGSALPRLVFEPNDALLRALGRRYVIDAIARWEPRVAITSTAIQTNDDSLNIAMTFSLRADPSQSPYKGGLVLKRFTGFQILEQFYNRVA